MSAPERIWAKKTFRRRAGDGLTLGGPWSNRRYDQEQVEYLRKDGLPREMAEALRELLPYAYEMIEDIAADAQEGGSAAGIEKWNAVVALLARWDEMEKD